VDLPLILFSHFSLEARAVGGRRKGHQEERKTEASWLRSPKEQTNHAAPGASRFKNYDSETHVE